MTPNLSVARFGILSKSDQRKKKVGKYSIDLPQIEIRIVLGDAQSCHKQIHLDFLVENQGEWRRIQFRD